MTTFMFFKMLAYVTEDIRHMDFMTYGCKLKQSEWDHMARTGIHSGPYNRYRTLCQKNYQF